MSDKQKKIVGNKLSITTRHSYSNESILSLDELKSKKQAMINSKALVVEKFNKDIADLQESIDILEKNSK